MRRVLIVSIAIMVVMFATTAVRAGEQQVSDRLLEILKDRQIISDSEYSELSDIANQMQDDQTAVDSRLEALDASVTEYLAKEGDEAEGVNVQHKIGSGFGFASGNFSLWIGGLFQFEYAGLTRKGAQSTNNFQVKEARFYFKGKAFIEGMTYKFQWKGNSSAVSLLDAYGNYDIAEGIQVRFGQFKVPYSRQRLNSVAHLSLMSRSIVVDAFAPGRDIGIMAWDTFGEEGEFNFEYAFGLFNGDGTNVAGNDNNWLGWAARFGVYPMGMVPYAETDFDASDFTAGIAGTYYSVRNRPNGNTVKRDQWEIDVVMKIAGFYVEGEYHNVKINPDGESSSDYSGWFIQGGFLIPNTDFEVLARYSMINWDEDTTSLKNSKEWVIGAAWYPNGYGHPLKVLLTIGEFKSDTSNDYKGSTGIGPITESYDIDWQEFETYLERTRFLKLSVQVDW